jgi:phage-related protein
MAAIEEFTWGARIGDQGAVAFSVLSAKFGDGYEQRVGNGINPRSESWPYTYIGPIDEVEPIKRFLDWHGGAQVFQWTPPFGQPGLFTCAGYNVTPKGGPQVQLTATFVQAYLP